MGDQRTELEEAAANVGVGSYRRHVLLCIGPDCCTPDVGQEAWKALKRELKEHDLTVGPNSCYRSKVGCLRICCHGPTMLVYPEGTWYHGMNAERIPQFVKQHLVEDKPVEEWVFARNPLIAD
jgi:(2Fe-2S) ferredoxin